MKEGYQADSITLLGAVSMGTGVMIGAGMFALTGQVTELVGPFFPLPFPAEEGRRHRCLWGAGSADSPRNRPSGL